MDDKQLIEQLKKLLEDCQTELDRMDLRARDTISNYQQQRKTTIEQAARIVCSDCQGHGKIRRLDHGFMRKFGLREWDGCQKCGGDGHDKAGRGFLCL